MPKYISTVRTDAAPAQVWPLVADLTRHGEWSADDVTVSPATGGGYESVATAKGREFRARLDVLASAEPSRFAFRATDATGTYEHEFALVPDGTGTTVTRTITATNLSPAQRLLFYAVLPVVKKPSARRSLERLAALAETTSTRSR
ncbi:MAG TPA: SRPBCC family protein [Mycobacteriales bacterium]|nr:SRPBCC family protein [Mycobacteriales bacterium]